MIRGILAAAIVALQWAAPAPAAPPNAMPYSERGDVQAFIREIVQRHGFVEKELVWLFSRVRPIEPIVRAISTPPDKSRPWQEYRALFLNDKRIAGGVAFWQENAAMLARAEKEFGVPAQYVVAIIGVETLYGRNTGKWRVVDALATLAFDYPPRAEFFRDELVQYLLLARDEGIDVFSLRGSYAGAFGIPQFMPGSARRWAVDFDGNGAVDLSRSPADAVGSVANFLRKHGWQAGAQVLLPARVEGEGYRGFATGSVEPRHPVSELVRAGVLVEQADKVMEERAALIELASPGAPSEFRVGLQNFYALTRYNRSAFYASAVHDLAEAIRRKRAGR